LLDSLLSSRASTTTTIRPITVLTQTLRPSFVHPICLVVERWTRHAGTQTAEDGGQYPRPGQPGCDRPHLVIRLRAVIERPALSAALQKTSALHVPIQM
jgi:hypothetical protein